MQTKCFCMKTVIGYEGDRTLFSFSINSVYYKIEVKKKWANTDIKNGERTIQIFCSTTHTHFYVFYSGSKLKLKNHHNFSRFRHAVHRNSDSTEVISFMAAFWLNLCRAYASWSCPSSFAEFTAKYTAVYMLNVQQCQKEKPTLTTLNFPYCLSGSQEEEGESTCMESFLCLWRQRQADLV